MTVLVLADESDLSVDMVVRALGRASVRVVRMDPAAFPLTVSIDAQLRGSAWEGKLVTGTDVLALEEVRAVWFQSSGTFRFPLELSAEGREHRRVEAKLGFGGVLATLPAMWVNHPSRIAESAYRPYQLAVAGGCGLGVPPTLVTSIPRAVQRFAAISTARSPRRRSAHRGQVTVACGLSMSRGLTISPVSGRPRTSSST